MFLGNFLQLSIYFETHCEEFATDVLTCWLTKTYSGWGLLSALIPFRQMFKFCKKLREIKENWPQDEKYSEEGCWAILFKDIDLEDIMPEINVKIYYPKFLEHLSRKSR